MGCTQSKIEHEEAVSRCKDRKVFMKEAVSARNAFAAAHTAYTMALKNTGAALSDYGQGEASDTLPAPLAAQPPRETLPPPPPLPPGMTSGNNLLRSASMPDIPLPKSEPKPSEPIIEEEDVEEDTGPTISAPTTPPPPLPLRPSSNPVPPPPDPDNTGTWDFFWNHDMPGPSLSEPEDAHREVHESSPERDHRYQEYKRPDEVATENVTRKSANVAVPERPERVVEPSVIAKPPKKPVQATVIHQTVGPSEGKRGKVMASNVNLLKILNDLDDNFLKASESAQEVSKMLEANRMHYHSNFADNRGHIDHSARVMRVITWNRSFKGMPNTDDGKDDVDSEEWETHATVLDKLLAWEKKLYDEVKAGELMKIDYQKKLSQLNKQKKRGASPETIEKTKAAVSHLHTRYIVDMQSMDSTVSEIQRLRDDLLHPKLVALVDGMAKMWETMHVHHDNQSKIVTDIRSLDISNTPKETTDQHHERTIQLCRIVNEWHTQFQKLMGHQKEYIKALNSWLKLNVIPIESSLREKVSSPPRVPNPPIKALLQRWHEELENLPTDITRNALSTFAAAIEAIVVHQEEERKQKEKCEEARKEYTRRNRQFEDWHRKYMEKRTPPDDMVDPDKPEETNPHDPVAERKLAVEQLEKRLADEMDAHQKLCIQVREKSLMSLKTHLPELFRAMAKFAVDSSETYKRLRSISHGIAEEDGSP